MNGENWYFETLSIITDRLSNYIFNPHTIVYAKPQAPPPKTNMLKSSGPVPISCHHLYSTTISLRDCDRDPFPLLQELCRRRSFAGEELLRLEAPLALASRTPQTHLLRAGNSALQMSFRNIRQTFDESRVAVQTVCPLDCFW